MAALLPRQLLIRRGAVCAAQHAPRTACVQQRPPRAASKIRSESPLALKVFRRSCYDFSASSEDELYAPVVKDAVVQVSASGRPQSRMVRKMIREIFGHPMAPTDCTVYIDRGKVLAVFHPIHSTVDVPRLQLGSTFREATQEEQSNIGFWYTARVRIDHEVAAYTELNSALDSEHVKFGTYSLPPDDVPVKQVSSSKAPQPAKPKNPPFKPKDPPLRLNTMRLRKKR